MMKKPFISALAILAVVSVGWIYLSQEPPPQPLGADEGCNGKWESVRGDPTPLAGEVADIPFHYLTPRWYQKSFNFADAKQAKFGNEFEVYARIMPWLTDMENVRFDFYTSDGLKITDGEPTMKGCGGSTEKCAFSEIIRKCDIREIRFKVKWESQPDETQRIRVIPRFDFPRRELIQYVEEDKNNNYDNPALKIDLLEFIKEYDDGADDSLKLIIN
jgi:hypothetical protein